MYHPAKIIIGSVEIQTAAVNGHGIRDVIFIVVDMSAEQYNSSSYNKLIKTAVQLRMCALSVDDNDYHMVMTLPGIWFAGDPEMITMFSLKYKNYIKASMNQETMDGAMWSLKAALLAHPNYYLNYIDALFRIAIEQLVVFHPNMRHRWRAGRDGRQDPTPRTIRVLLETPR